MLKGKKIHLVAAMAKNRVIGAANRIPWRVPGEQERFRRLTMGNLVVLGSRTGESIGRPLPGRDVVVLTRSPELSLPGYRVCRSFEEVAQVLADDPRPDAFIAGGEQIYRLFLPLADRIYLTEIDLEVEGDAIFPEFSEREFDCVERVHVHGEVPYDYLTYARRPAASDSI